MNSTIRKKIKKTSTKTKYETTKSHQLKKNIHERKLKETFVMMLYCGYLAKSLLKKKTKNN